MRASFISRRACWHRLLPLAGAALLACSGPGGMGGREDLGGADQRGPGPGPCAAVPGDVQASRQQARTCGVGTAAALLLRAAPYPKLVIEVDAAGATPRQAALDHLRAVIAAVTAKPGGVSVKMGDTLPAPGHPLTTADLVALEDAHRHEFALGDTAVLYYLVVADPSADDTKDAQVLGLAYRASSLAVFEGTIDRISGGLGQPSADVVASTVVAHELGHVLGLVNIGTPMVQPHEDPAHQAHDVNKDCLMYWANNSSQLLPNLLGGGVIADFDAQCKADLAAVRDRQ